MSGSSVRPYRRVHSHHDPRTDGISDLVIRARGASVLDLGCNKGHTCWEFADHGARLVNGMDLSPEAILTARDFFAERADDVASQFEVGDLTQGPSCLAPFGTGGYDIVLLMGTYHKIKRKPSQPYKDMGAKGMTADELSSFMRHLGHLTHKYFAFRGDIVDFDQVDQDLSSARLRRIQVSHISPLGPTGIWIKD